MTPPGYFDEASPQRMLVEYPLGRAFLEGVARASRDELRALQERRFRAVVNRAQTAAEQVRLTRDYFDALAAGVAPGLSAAA